MTLEHTHLFEELEFTISYDSLTQDAWKIVTKLLQEAMRTESQSSKFKLLGKEINNLFKPYLFLILGTHILIYSKLQTGLSRKLTACMKLFSRKKQAIQIEKHI